jgi:ATP-dependent DNA ligase
MAQYLNLKPIDFDDLSAKAQAKVKWEGRMLLPKYDGCMALVGFWHGQPDFILSRDGKPVESMDHIYDELLEVYPMLKSAPGGYCFVGEAWVAGMEFKDISGTFRRKRPQPVLEYAVFDQVNYTAGADDLPILKSGLPYKERVWQLAQHARLCSTKIVLPIAITCTSKEHAESYARDLKAAGSYDGAIASDPDATYAPGNGSGAEFLKLKPLLSFTLEVVGFEASTGDKTGRPTGALVVRFKQGTCKVGTGLSEAEQADLSSFVGKMIEVACMGVYAGDIGKMREPRYVGIRDDVLTPDF